MVMSVVCQRHLTSLPPVASTGMSIGEHQLAFSPEIIDIPVGHPKSSEPKRRMRGDPDSSRPNSGTLREICAKGADGAILAISRQLRRAILYPKLKVEAKICQHGVGGKLLRFRQHLRNTQAGQSVNCRLTHICS
jgi:hypothetical protein